MMLLVPLQLLYTQLYCYPVASSTQLFQLFVATLSTFSRDRYFQVQHLIWLEKSELNKGFK